MHYLSCNIRKLNIPCGTFKKITDLIFILFHIYLILLKCKHDAVLFEAYIFHTARKYRRFMIHFCSSSRENEYPCLQMRLILGGSSRSRIVRFISLCSDTSGSSIGRALPLLPPISSA